MKLRGVTIAGIKRFRDPTFLRVAGKLTALVGPNEAGKTTLLEAIALLDLSSSFPESLRARGHQGSVFVEGLFQLEPHEADSLGLNAVTSVRVRRNVGAQNLEWTLDPSPEPRLDEREDLRTRLNAALSGLAERVSGGEIELNLGDAQEAAQHLARQDLFDRTKQIQLEGVAADLTMLGGSEEELARDIREHLNRSSIDLIELELAELLPRFLYFGPRESELRDAYVIDTAHDQPSLSNLALLVDLDLATLRSAAARNDPSAAVGPLKIANERLSTAFTEVWTQRRLAVQIHGDFRDLQREVQVFIGDVKEDGEDFFKPTDRSAGLRWFVALFAFLRGAHGELSRPPILLVDEADTHLHYDAQADLVRQMMVQTLTAELIYTTHSAGCLPPDLSNVRVVDPIGSQSKIVNKFWASRDSTVSALIVRMGASSFAFTRSRSAIATEGPSDYILLPSLFREVDEKWDARSIQIVPALATVGDAQLAELDREAGRMVYLTDADDAGRAIQRRLQEAGIPEQRIFEPSAVIEVEDFIARDALAWACQGLSDLVGAAATVSAVDFPITGRGAYIDSLMEKWPRSPTKVDIAEFVVEWVGQLYDESHVKSLRELHSKIVAELGEVGPQL